MLTTKRLILAAALLLPGVAWADDNGMSAPSGPAWSAVTISGCCTIHQDGRVELHDGVKLDDASKAFWAAMSQFGMQNCRPVEGAKP